MFNIYTYVKRLDKLEKDTEINSFNTYNKAKHIGNYQNNLVQRNKLAANYGNKIKKFIIKVILLFI